MAEIKRKDIGGYTYTVSPLTGKKATRVFVRLCHMFGPIVKTINPDNADGIEGQAMAGVSEALTQLKEEDLEYLQDIFMAQTNVARTDTPEKAPLLSAVFETHWIDRFPDMFAWLFFCIQVNYSGFLGGNAAGFLAALGLKRKAQSGSKSPDTSTGISGDSQ